MRFEKFENTTNKFRHEMKKSNLKFLSELRNYLIITFGLFIFVLGWTAFLIPAQIVGSGVSGIGTILFYAIGVPVGYTNLAVNAIFLLVAMKLLGAKFGLNTIFGIITSSVLFIVLQTVITEPIVQEQFMATLLGGIMSGVGVGIAIANGGNSGGTDILAMIVNKYRNISPGRVILYCDVVIIASSYFVFHSIEKIVYGYVMMAVAAYSIDMVLDGAKQSYQITIISKLNREIAELIANQTGRGITFLKGEGWYTKKDQEVIMVIARKNDKPKILRIIKETDRDAFISIAKVSGVFGENFDKIKM